MTQTTESKQSQSTPKRNPSYIRQVVHNVCPGFIVNDDNREKLNSLYDYVHGSGTLDPNKGILFFGPVGTGKSTLMKILAEYQRLYGRGFKCVNCAMLASEYSAYGIEALNSSTYNEGERGIKPVERGFDEFGRESVPAKYFGNELNVMQHILQIRYDIGVKTHMTTNIELESIESIYGPHIYDRMIEMFNFVELKGDSFRK